MRNGTMERRLNNLGNVGERGKYESVNKSILVCMEYRYNEDRG
jgi:hypothetical protein